MRITAKTIAILIGFSIILLTACKPSDKYVGSWYALSDEGEVKLHFSKEKELTVTDKNDHEDKYEFNQNKTGFINEVRYFGIKMQDDNYYVVFDNKKDEDNAKLIKQTNHASDFEDVTGDVIFKMNRDEYPRE